MTRANGKAVSTVAIYARVSTDVHGQDTAMQIRELREYVKVKGWEITSEYIDHGVSGMKDSRPSLNRIMADAEAHKFDALMVWKMDRFSRSLKHLVVSLANLEKWGVAFISLKDNIDMTTPAGRLQAQMIGAFNEFACAMIRENVRSGLAHRKALIEKNGFFISKKGNRRERLGRNARTDIDVKEIARLRYSEGLDWREIADRTGVPRSTCFRVCPKNLAESA